MPKISSSNNDMRAATNLVDALKHTEQAAPFARIGEKQQASPQQLAEIFGTAVQPLSPDHPDPRVAPAPPLRVEVAPTRVMNAPAPRVPKDPDTIVQEALRVHPTQSVQPVPVLRVDPAKMHHYVHTILCNNPEHQP